MRTFKFEPNHVVRFNPPIGMIRHVQFDENGLFTTDNERIIARFFHAFDSVPGLSAVEVIEPSETADNTYSCKKCDFTTDNRGLLMAHYRQAHPKEG